MDLTDHEPLGLPIRSFGSLSSVIVTTLRTDGTAACRRFAISAAVSAGIGLAALAVGLWVKAGATEERGVLAAGVLAPVGVPEEHPTRSKGITARPMRQVVRLVLSVSVCEVPGRPSVRLTRALE
jgi:hypothetical protein